MRWRLVDDSSGDKFVLMRGGDPSAVRWFILMDLLAAIELLAAVDSLATIGLLTADDTLSINFFVVLLVLHVLGLHRVVSRRADHLEGWCG